MVDIEKPNKLSYCDICGVKQGVKVILIFGLDTVVCDECDHHKRHDRTIRKGVEG